MSYLYFFVGLLFIIGLLLVSMTFFAYSKLQNKCSSDSLKSKLRVAIMIGSALIALAVGFYICANHANCACPLEASSFKIYSIVGFSLICGISLLILTLGINSDLKDPNCNVDLSVFVWILGAIATIQLICSVIYIINLIRNRVKNRKVGVEDVSSSDSSDEKHDTKPASKPVLEDSSDDSSLEEQSDKEAELLRESRAKAFETYNLEINKVSRQIADLDRSSVGKTSQRELKKIKSRRDELVKRKSDLETQRREYER